MGSLFAALTTSVAGLNAQSSAIGNISDNLANANTTGYKSVGTNFEELVNASNSAVNNPGGVKATPQYQNDVQGSITSSNTATSLAISGSGYFAVQTGAVNSSGQTIFGSTLYTRQGDFTLDKNGYLVNGSGYFLTGDAIDSVTNSVAANSTPIQVSALQNNPVATSKITYVANLPANAATNYTSSTSTAQIYDVQGTTHDVNYTWNKTGTNTWSVKVTIPDGKDSNGNSPYTTTIPFVFSDGSTTGSTAGTVKTISSYTASTPSFTVSNAPSTGSFVFGTAAASKVSVDWAQMSGNASSPIRLFYSVGGTTKTIANFAVTTGSSATIAATNMTNAINAIAAAESSNPIAAVTATSSSGLVSLSTFGATPQEITPNSSGTTGDVVWSGTLAGNDGTAAESAISPYSPTTIQTAGAAATVGVNVVFPSTGAGTQALTLNFGAFNGSTGVTQFSDSNTSVSVSDFSQDGLPKGSFNNLSIDKDGFVSLTYSNGTTKNIAKVPLALFNAQDQLQRVSGGAYAATQASGNPNIVDAGTQGSGSISNNSLEQSNVDIASEFTTLIKAQQVYTANSKVVTTDNQLLQVTINMIQ